MDLIIHQKEANGRLRCGSGHIERGEGIVIFWIRTR
jgi:hypothetical protein